jgi:hypothetical protein
MAGTAWDLIRDIEEAKADLTQFSISPRNWGKFPKLPFTLSWNTVPFDSASIKSIPAKSHGVYTFVIDPKVCSHPKNSFVAYVGKAERMTIRARFESYLRDKEKLKRPQITYLLGKYYKNLAFCFLEVPSPHSIEHVEDSLIAALDPPFNHEQPVEVSLVRRGLT